MRKGSREASSSSATGFCMETASRMALKILSPPGAIGQRHAVGGGFAQQLGRSLIHLEQLSLAVGHDDGLEDGLQHGVGELKLHLAAPGLGFPQLAQPDGDAVQLSGDHAEAVAAAPLHAVLQVALGDPAGVAGQQADGPQHKVDGRHRDHRRSRHKQERELELSRRRQGVVRGRPPARQ